MCWRKQTIYKSCRHGRIEEIVCDDEKRRRREHAHVAALSSTTTRSRREQDRRSPWLVLFCPCFFLAPAAPPREERCRPKPTLEPLNGKCPRCLEEEANAAVCSGPGFVVDDHDDNNPPFRPEDAAAEASRRCGFIGDKHLHAAGRPASHDAYGGTGSRRNSRRGRSGSPSRSRRKGTDPTEVRLIRQPLYTNIRYEKAKRRERIRREQCNGEGPEHYSQRAQRTPGYRSGNQDQNQDHDQNQRPSGSTASPGGGADSQLFQPEDSTAHPAPLLLQRSMARADRVTMGARAKRGPLESVVLENGSGWGVRNDTAASPPEFTPGLSLDELFEEVEELWRTAPNQRR
ncbi:hypothetical protein CGRA01v4_05132 [Colletotrichum graminicola]|uniref:Uncharacterized protein n=1 Tax=Colletotrichum graminicola (strain M1.001 / M2 / FGSC 10212) TaxID=645133 RepID=E3QES3_COLGM|nr:uncharacterized protein GLRG_04523 [Colletotrichum graminicola M1.001]EFQ29379.1 hypothetical protein GLRG_04523 [Colletotrichum graminicola M1.001]WDK13851.1 hypothetical protein CGRA01v4_05132 [Colletotrichum graminicola]